MTTATLAPVTETYANVQNLIYHMCNLFARKHGGDVEEMIAEANLMFMKVYNSETFDPDKGSFNTYLSNSIYRRLLELKRRSCKQAKVWATSIGPSDFDDGQVFDNSVESRDIGKFDFDDFLHQLGEDAQVVFDLIFNSPEEIHQVAMAKGGEGRNWRSTIRSYLKDMSWSAYRISQAFDDIRRVMA